jgi:DNA (cytosine-5)-methyltransferase 1
MATATVRYLEMHKPRIFTLENVYQYRNFESWHYIARALLDLGYAYNFWHVNMADYGVPQTRKRMIAIARRDGVLPQLPEKTHGRQERRGLFGNLARWVSWYDAIEDLIPDLPDSEFAPWQLARLPEELQTFVAAQGSYGECMPTVKKNNPMLTITGNNNQTGIRALLVEASNATGGSDRRENEPSQTVTTPTGGRVQRAFIIDGKVSSSGDKKVLQINTQDQPGGTIISSATAYRDSRAYANGRIVKMTPRALARFQSFPDWYELPDSAALAAKGIGNAVPPLFAEKLFKEVQFA